MVGIGFCSSCDMRIFGDEVEGEDYFKADKNRLICGDCTEEMKKCKHEYKKIQSKRLGKIEVCYLCNAIK